jgi:hypothetical protein
MCRGFRDSRAEDTPMHCPDTNPETSRTPWPARCIPVRSADNRPVVSVDNRRLVWDKIFRVINPVSEDPVFSVKVPETSRIPTLV